MCGYECCHVYLIIGPNPSERTREGTYNQISFFLFYFSKAWGYFLFTENFDIWGIILLDGLQDKKLKN